MSLFDWFFPEQAQATHLRRLADQNKRERSQRSRYSRDLAYRVGVLEDNLGFVSLVLGSLLEKLDKKDVVDREDLRGTMSQLDAIDGFRDGRLDVEILKDRQYQADVLQILDSTAPDTVLEINESNPTDASAASENPAKSDRQTATNPSSSPQTTTEKAAGAARLTGDTQRTDSEIERLQSYLDELRRRREADDAAPGKN